MTSIFPQISSFAAAFEDLSTHAQVGQVLDQLVLEVERRDYNDQAVEIDLALDRAQRELEERRAAEIALRFRLQKLTLERNRDAREAEGLQATWVATFEKLKEESAEKGRLRKEVSSLKVKLRRANKQGASGRMPGSGMPMRAAMGRPLPLAPHDKPVRTYLDTTEYMESGDHCSLWTVAPPSMLLRVLGLYIDVSGVAAWRGGGGWHGWQGEGGRGRTGAGVFRLFGVFGVYCVVRLLWDSIRCTIRLTVLPCCM